MASARVLHMPTRLPVEYEYDLPPCRNSWGSGCDHAGGQGAHICWTWTGWPHVCRCMRCASLEGAGHG